MNILLPFFLMLAAQDPAPLQEQPLIDETVAPQAEEEEMLPPMTVGRWSVFTQRGKDAYAQVTLEQLRRSKDYANCLPDDAHLFAQVIDQIIANNGAKGPLLMPVAMAAQAYCS